MTQYQNHSVLISNLLDYKGYGGRMLSIRRKMQSSYADDMNKKSSWFEFSTIIVGSKAEGLSGPLENDSDIMKVLKDTVCKEHFTSVTYEREHQFKLALDHSRPGYSLLQTIQICNSVWTATLLYESMVELAPNTLYLSSEFLKNKIKALIIDGLCKMPRSQEFVNIHNETQGPSIVFDSPGLTDTVTALRCECPSYLSAWLCRERNYQWPPIAVVREVSNLDSHVVPVGHTASCFQFLEWRICFTKGEIRLVHSLNDCLIKVLILLKQIAKVTLKPLSKDMSTYLMKNVVFWLAELNDYDCFTQYALIVALKKALAYLKHFVVTNNFPSYMIPQRNLLEGKLTHSQRIKICMRIDSLLKEGPHMVLKIAKIRTAISMCYKSPTVFSRISMKLHEIHIILYLFAHLYIHSLPETPHNLADTTRSYFSSRIAGFILCRLSSSMLDVEQCYKDLGYFKFSDSGDNISSLISEMLC
ncbi:uncharacterized protein LOC132759914 [Ruditapes philippinarum]|uniref:uncharacterized protein LOC132759914 n=1 Tax=Ruditapes philippinarum TaxID=129788 RepID=UPI00295B366B|nr:uncharacterized protein LOC132759914 [Ruditapes philippinarum]XP_060607771.1 uncharacterized protein LOC132759914 [Ruditapes philippinarum]XP_060607772.1 uncharacterized protein LOC132759914 [Ruditapes philippinarum]